MAKTDREVPLKASTAATIDEKRRRFGVSFGIGFILGSADESML
jgi:hypothetical protein